MSFKCYLKYVGAYPTEGARTDGKASLLPKPNHTATGAALDRRPALAGFRSGWRALLPVLALLALVPQVAAAKPQMIQLGLYQKAGVAWWAWKSVEQREPDVAKLLQPLVSPLDPKKPEADVALRAVVPSDVNVNTLCRRMISAGLGCLEIEAPVATVKVDPPAEVKPAAVPQTATLPAAPAIPPLSPPVVDAPVATPAVAPATAPSATVPAVVTTRVGVFVLPRVKPILTAAKPAPEPVQVAALPPAAPAPAPVPVIANAPVPVPAVPPMPAAQPAAATPPASAPPLAMASTDPSQVNIPAMVLSGILPSLPSDGTIVYRPDEARTMSDIDRRSRRQGRLGAVLPGGRFDVTPAVLTQSGINYCALTLDDGPHRTVTRRILDVLAVENVKVTYFPIGKPSEINGPVIQDFLAQGHEVGNHSLTHADLRAASPEKQRFEIEETNRILRGFGANPVLFRPPYGRYNETLLRIAHDLGMSTVLWNVDTRDWQVRDPDKIVQTVQTAAGTGSVLLLHSTYPTTAVALPRVIADLRGKGCQFVTLSQWIERMRQLAEPPVIAAGPGTATN
jgi:peptidoglycan-N-acetylglucosamine deacetylase